MILFRDYNKEKRLDRVWFDSSNIVYSECDDHVNALKTLRIVFKTGDMYEYDNVDVNDYLMFVAGGLDSSNGKAFFKYIRNKYECRKMEPVNLEELRVQMEELKKLKQEELEKGIGLPETEEKIEEQK